MDSKQFDIIVNLLTKLCDLTKKSIQYNEVLLRLFQQYDAEIFENEEVKRELNQYNSGDNQSKGKSILGNTGRS